MPQTKAKSSVSYYRWDRAFMSSCIFLMLFRKYFR